MNWFTDALSHNTLHHAYAIQTNDDRVVLSIIESCRANDQISLRHHEHDSFGIDDARALAFLMMQANEFSTNIHIISSPSFTREAQNALLKTLEEPSRGLHMILVSSSIDQLIPTIKSRLSIMTLGSHDLPSKIDPVKFLSLTPHKRIDLIKKTVAKKDYLKRSDAIYFLDQLEIILAQDEERSQYVSEIYEMKKILHMPASSIKMCLGHVALSL